MRRARRRRLTRVRVAEPYKPIKRYVKSYTYRYVPKPQDVGNRIIRRLDPIRRIRRPTQRVRSIARKVRRAQVVKRNVIYRSSECKRRKEYRKEVLKQVAAQVKRMGGNGSIQKWRRKRASNRRSVKLC